MGCGATAAQLKSRAAFDLGCEESELSIVEIDARTRGVTGCGRQVTYVASCEGANQAACTWVMNSDATTARSPAGRQSARDNPDLIVTKATYDTIAAENAQTERVVVLSVGPRHKKLLRYTALTQKQSFRECKEIALVADAQRTALPARYRGQLQGQDVNETLEVDVEDALLAKLGGASEASLEVCGAKVALSAAFRAAMPKPAPVAVTEPSASAEPEVRLRLSLESTVMVLQASPASGTGTAWLGLLVKGSSTQPQPCEVKLVLEGEAVALPPFAHADDPEGDAYRAEVPLALLERMTKATRAVGKVCETRFRLAEAELTQVKDFLVRYREEQALSQ